MKWHENMLEWIQPEQVFFFCYFSTLSLLGASFYECCFLFCFYFSSRRPDNFFVKIGQTCQILSCLILDYPFADCGFAPMVCSKW